MSTLAVAFLSFLAGAAVIGLVIFVILLLRSMKQMQETLQQTNKLLQPAVDGFRLSDMTKIFETLAKVGIELGKRTDVITSTLVSLQKVVFNNPENPLSEVVAGAGDTASGFFAHSDELAALREQVEELKKKGIDVDERSAFHPREEEAVKEQV